MTLDEALDKLRKVAYPGMLAVNGYYNAGHVVDAVHINDAERILTECWPIPPAPSTDRERDAVLISAKGSPEIVAVYDRVLADLDAARAERDTKASAAATAWEIVRMERKEHAIDLARLRSSHARLLEAAKQAYDALRAPTGDQQEWKDVLENKALPVLRAAIAEAVALKEDTHE